MYLPIFGSPYNLKSNQYLNHEVETFTLFRLIGSIFNYPGADWNGIFIFIFLCCCTQKQFSKHGFHVILAFNIVTSFHRLSSMIFFFARRLCYQNAKLNGPFMYVCIGFWNLMSRMLS